MTVTDKYGLLPDQVLMIAPRSSDSVWIYNAILRYESNDSVFAKSWEKALDCKTWSGL